MTVPKKLTIVFLFFYVAVILYLFAFFFIPEFQVSAIEFRQGLSSITEGANYYWAIIIAVGICFLGSASIGFPIPFPFVLFSLSNSIYLKYLGQGLAIEQVLSSGPFWGEILILAVFSGLGCALGEVTGYIVGFGAKKLAEETHSDMMKNIDGFGKVILMNEKRAPLYIFLFALTPLPDDILFLPLGMIKYPFWKCIIPGWLGKNFTTLFYCAWPILIALGFMATGYESNDVSSIVTEAIMMLVTITIMFFIMSFNWDRYLQERQEKKKLELELEATNE